MSSFTTNTNFVPPPQQSGPMNSVNGQQQQQQQQQYQQQLLQQQQQSMQQNKTQQLPSMSTAAPPTFNSNLMNKFMPPTFPQGTAATTTATTTGAPFVNGPMRPPLMPANALSTLPPHLRPPTTMNGPPTHFTNGGSEVASTNSSRTGSPALQTMPSPLQQQQQQHQQQAPGTGQVPPSAQLTSQTAGQVFRTQIGANVMPPAAVATTTTNVQNYANANRVNGTSMTQPQQQQQQQQHPQTPTSNTHGSIPPTSNTMQRPPQFKTSALNANVVTSPTSQAFNTNANSPISTQAMQRPNTFQSKANNMPPTVPLSSHPASVFGTSTPPLMSSTPTTQQQPITQNTNYQKPGGNNMPPLPPQSMNTNALQQQNQLNNNQQQQQVMQQPQPPHQQRKPMYPTNTPLPVMQPTNVANLTNSMQNMNMNSGNGALTQPYAQAYHQQPQQAQYQQQQQQPQPQPPGMFNGQPNSGQLQYQSQPMMPQQPTQTHPFPAGPAQYNSQLGVTQQGFSRLWGQDTIDLMQNRHILSPATLPPPKIVLHNQFHESINCSPSIMRSTIAKIPESNSLLQKSRLPLGILIHPFRDINSLPVIQCPNIVRCRLCRTYINPFVYFVDSKMWKCNLCYRVNELPEDFQFDPATKTYGDVTRRPEVRSSTIEFIAPSEYMLRPPQPAIYLFLFDVSIIAQQSGFLECACAVLSKHLDDMPGDARTQVGFIAYDSQVHFYSMAEGYNQPHEMTLLDIDEPFLPRPDNLLVNLKECKELVRDLLSQLPTRFADTHDPGSALGAALQVAYKLMQAAGGRITVFQTCLPNKGPGSLEPREDPNNRSAKDVAHLNPATDFYKRFALECAGYQIAVDLFLMNQQYSDLATISGVSKHSGGCVHHFPLYQKTKPQHVDSFKQCFKRYLVRKIGFEAVMRIRCTRGLQVHTFHGNFFVRSTDLLSLPNVNPDAGYGMQISYEESLTDVKTICFQAALLYTNSEGERRIRVHTLCLPVTSSLPEIMHAADTEAIIGLLSKMAVDRSITSNVADAREAFMNATVDVFNAFKIAQNLPSGQTGSLIAPRSLALMPMYILALLKHPAFRVGTSTRLDDRVTAMDCMKTLPLDQLLKFIYPEFYNIDVLFYNLNNSNTVTTEDDDEDDYLPDVPRLQLSAEYLDSRSIFLMDCGTLIMIYVGLNVPSHILESTFGIKSTAELPDYCYGFPVVDSLENDILKRFMMRLNDEKPYSPLVQIIRDTSTAKPQLIEKLVDDRSESSLSYYEFLQHIRTQVK